MPTSLCPITCMPSSNHRRIRPSRVLQSFGSFTAHAILTSLRGEERHDLPAFFSQRAERDASKEYQIWQPVQAKNVYSAAFLREKLDYIHNNPVAKHWRLVENRADYAYSSACFYDVGRMPIVQVDDVREWLL
jgi:putative transposase